MAKTADEVLGFEYDWLATDGDGHVAIFSTAGGGFAPEAFLLDPEAHDTAIDAILTLPAASSQRPQTVDYSDVWGRAVQRGLFVFDSDFHGGPYRRVEVPSSPVQLTELPPSVIAVAKSIELRNLYFRVLTKISRELLESALAR